MALFGRNKSKDQNEKVETKKSASKAAPKKEKGEAKEKESKNDTPQGIRTTSIPETILVRPHVTEKAAIATDDGVYTFVVESRATKKDVARAVHALYNKTPRQVRIARKKPIRVRRRGGYGVKPGFKKAYVYLNKGETIDVL